ncbi:oligosaccharide flippase family protein [Vibrio sp. Of14-4]|uniref:lipopolysaccharide biosynthesis protein n=1 Tax=Vibrio sp. Of14-4 TaxID=2724878 RepID=UPI001EF1E005|nr:oligosaccharide flippase family protein [Vibrio sp. Of14-4]
MSSKVFKNSYYYMLAAFLPTLVGFLMLPVYTQYLTPEDYGIIALVMSLQGFLPLLMTLQIPSSLTRFYFEYHNDIRSLKVFISTILFFLFFISTVVTLLLILYLSDIVYFVFPSLIDHEKLFFIGVLSSYFGIFTSLFSSLIRVQQKAKLIMKISLGLFLFSLLVNIMEVIVLKRGAYGVIEGTFISSIVTFLTYYIVTRKFIILSFNYKLLIEPLKFSIPLIPYSISGLIFLYSDRIIMEKYVSISIVGLYMFSDKISSIFKMMANEFNSAFLPYFNSVSKKSKDQAIIETRNIALVFLYIISMFITILSLFSYEMVFLLFNDDYLEAWQYIPFLSFAYIFRALYNFSSCALFYDKKTGRIAFVNIFSGIVNISLNLWLIPIYGINAAVLSTLISFIFNYIISEFISYNSYGVILFHKQLFMVITYSFSTLILSYWINSNFINITIIDYVYKLILVFLGLFIGYKMNIMKLSIFKYKA